MAELASPTPGKMTLSALRISSGSSVTIASTPKRSSAKLTEQILPALYFMMTVFIYFLFHACNKILYCSVEVSSIFNSANKGSTYDSSIAICTGSCKGSFIFDTKAYQHRVLQL